MEQEIELEKNNNIKIENKQNNFINNSISKIINNAIDIGLRAILPDFIENEIIDIKDALLENGLKGGIKEAINSAIDFGKSAQGIITGNFENINQINYAISNGGIIDKVSNIIDFATDKAYNSNIINKTVNTLIKEGKNIILDNITNNIKKELEQQSNYFNKLNENIEGWKNNYNNKNFEEMEKSYKKIMANLEQVIPIEKIIKEAREIETLHNLIKNNGNDFNISPQELELVNKLN